VARNKHKSWPVAAMTSGFALLVIYVFLLLPNYLPVIQIDQRVAEILSAEEARAEAEALEREAEIGLICDRLEGIIQQIREVQKLDNPYIVADAAPISTALRVLPVDGTELEYAVSNLERVFDPDVLAREVSGTSPLSSLLSDPVVETRIERIETICSQ